MCVTEVVMNFSRSVSFVSSLKEWVFWRGDLRARDHLGDLGIDGRIIIKLIFKKWDREVWTGLS
jgi:hypothetical protein